jgi:hypothetical protein
MELKIERELESNDYAQIIMDDVYRWFDEEDEELGSAIGMDLEVRWMTRLHTVEDSVEIIGAKGEVIDYVSYPDIIRRNFAPEQVMFGKAKSKQILACLDDEVLAYIRKRRHFVLRFCGVDIPRDVINGEREMEFEFTTSSDT